MADKISRQRQGQMVQAVLTVLKDHPDGLPAREVIGQMQKILPPTEWESGGYSKSPGTPRYVRYVRFTTISPVKAGWLVKDKGTWIATSDGLAALDKYTDPGELMRAAVRLYREWKKAQPDDALDEDVSADGDDVDADVGPSVTLEEAEETARREILDYLAGMPPYDLQDLMAALLRAMGYHVAWIAPPGPDRGVDIVAYTDPLGATGPRIKVQVKRRADKIAVQEMRSFFAVLGNSDVGIFISLGGFTSEAQAEARQQETRRISLIGAGELIDLWVEHYERIPESSRQLLPLRPIYYLAPSS